MFIISVGMPKSGSTLLSLFQRDIVVKTIKGNGQELFEQMIREGKINGIGIFVNGLEKPDTLKMLSDLSGEIGPFIVKTHIGITAFLAGMLGEKKVLATYIHRDPRDVILSSIDHGKRPSNHPAMNPFFLQFESVRASIPLVKEFCKTGVEWIRSGLCEVYTYHDLLVEPEAVMEKFCRYISTVPDKVLFRELIRVFSENAEKGRKQFNTGKLLRYPDEMSPEEIADCNRDLAEELTQMGYGSGK
jgi:hypothetical protein